MSYRRYGALCISLAAACFMPAARGMQAQQIESCIASSAQYHSVNETILRAILMVESQGRYNVVSKNSNRTVDVGIAGTNSIHFPELAKHGITPSQLFDPCVSIYVAGWNLSKRMARWGNTWFGIAAYHSQTPYYNNRYQILLHNALIDLGAIVGEKRPVPPLKQPK